MSREIHAVTGASGRTGYAPRPVTEALKDRVDFYFEVHKKND
jgi:hypothetical protein